MKTKMDTSDHMVEASVHERYASAANQVESALCCPVEYSADFLSVIPEEILERDYGCGDPTPFVNEHETVLDLGSGGGKLCYILAQVVGKRGRVIGVDCNQQMLALARRHQETIAERLGFANVDFRYGLIQDLRLDLDLLGRELGQHPVREPADWLALRHLEERLKREQPMVADESIDCVVSNCVLNLVRQQDRRQLFDEVFRVLRRGGRAAISDIVSDEDVPQELQRDPKLWSGCISGAIREDRFLQAFADAGLYGIEIVAYQDDPWAVVDGIEFRSMTVVAHKGLEGACLEHNDAVVYNGPWKEVLDDNGHRFRRGERTAVCRKTYELMTSAPYASAITPIVPRTAIDAADAQPFECEGTRVRAPYETKAGAARPDVAPGTSCCEPGACC